MKTFNVYEHEIKGIAVVKVGFSWPAFFFTFFWLLIKRLWGMAVLYFFMWVVMNVLIYLSPFSPNNSSPLAVVGLLIFFSLHLIPGFKGNKWIELYLKKHGYVLISKTKAKSKTVAVSNLGHIKSQGNILGGNARPTLIENEIYKIEDGKEIENQTQKITSMSSHHYNQDNKKTRQESEYPTPMRDVKCKDKMSSNQPLRSDEYGKLLLALVLLAFSVFFIFGIPAAAFIVLGFIFMKIKQDFSYIDTAVKYCRKYLLLGVVVCTLLLLFSTSMLMYEYISGKGHIDRSGDLGGMLAGSIIGYVTIFVYFKALYGWFYDTLKTHEEWVVINGVMASKVKESNVRTQFISSDRIDIIGNEKFKRYSVADELKKWGKLRDDGYISEQEFQKAKEKLFRPPQ